MLGEMHGKDLSESLIRAYWESLKPYHDSVCIDAFKNAIHRIKWFPKVAELVAYIEQDAEPTSALSTFAAAMQGAKDFSDYDFPPPLRDPIARQVLAALGGYEALAHTDRDKVEWFQKRWVEMYVDLAANPERVNLLEAGPARPVRQLIEGAVKGIPGEKKRATAPKPSPSQKEKPMRKPHKNTLEDLRRQAQKLKGRSQVDEAMSYVEEE